MYNKTLKICVKIENLLIYFCHGGSLILKILKILKIQH